MNTGNNTYTLDQVVDKLVKTQASSIEYDILNLTYKNPSQYIYNCISMLKNWIIVCEIEIEGKRYSTLDSYRISLVEACLKEKIKALVNEIRKKEEYKAILRKKRLIGSTLRKFFSQYRGSTYSISSFYPDGDFYLECTVPSIFHGACFRLISWNTEEELVKEINKLPGILEEERQKEIEEEKEKLIARVQWTTLTAILDEKICPLGISYEPQSDEWTKSKGVRFNFAEEPTVPLIGEVHYLSRNYFDLNSDLESQVDSVKERLEKIVSEYKAIESMIQRIDAKNLSLWSIFPREGYYLVKREFAYVFAVIRSFDEKSLRKELRKVLRAVSSSNEFYEI